MVSLVEKLIHSGARRLGYRVESFRSAPYGIDWWRDVQRLSAIWKIDVAKLKKESAERRKLPKQ